MRFIQTFTSGTLPPSVTTGPVECETERRAFLRGVMRLMQTSHTMRTKAAERFPRTYKHELYALDGKQYVLEDDDVCELHALFIRPENLRFGMVPGRSHEERRLERASFKAMLCALAKEAGAPPPDFEAMAAAYAKRSNE